MVLTKKDINTAIAETENQDAIRHSLSNYFEGLDEPVSVAISLNSKNSTNSLLNRKDIQNIVNLLREKGFDAVSTMDSESALPSKFIVSKEGIQTPFLAPEDALKAATIIEDAICNQESAILSGHANLLSNESILYPADKKIRNYSDRSIHIEEGHPHPERITEILSKYGESLDSFIDRKVTEAGSQAFTLDFKAEQQNNMINGRENLWRGATLLGKPYACIAPRNARRVAYASSDILTSSGYTGYGSTSSGTGGAQYKCTKSKKHYGCLFKFKSLGDEQIYYNDTGLEAAAGGHSFAKDEIGLGFETAVYRHKNKLEAMYLQVGSNQFYKIPTDENGKITDPEWQDFASLHEPSDDTIYGYEAVRRNAQKQQQDANPKHCYKLELQNNLEPKKYDEKHYTTEEITNAIAYKGHISADNNGHMYINQDVEIDIDTGNTDLKNLTVYGQCTLNNMGKMSILDMPDIRKTENGLSTKIKINGAGILTDVNKVSTSDLLKVIGGWANDTDYNSSVISLDPRIELDALPKDFNSYKYNAVSINCTVDRLEDFPNTTRGCSYIKVRDQSSIENMSTDEFNAKVMGDFDALHYHSLSLSTTNITTFPKDMRDKYFDNVHMNPEYKISSLDNFPKTKNGISGINFEGSLSNLTTEEFLVKIKGEEWYKNNVSKDETGNITIKNFNLEPDKFTIKEYPKDIENYRFTSLFAEQTCREWNNASNEAKFSKKLNQPEVTLTSKDTPNLSKISELNLSNCKKINLYGVDLSNMKVILPKNCSIEIGENVKFAPDFQLDLSNCDVQNIHPSVLCGEIKLPQKLHADELDIISIPAKVQEITTSCISESHGRFKIPSNVKIIDIPDKNGKKISLKQLKAKGLSQEQIKSLRKERLLEPFKKVYKRFSAKKEKGVQPAAVSVAANTNETEKLRKTLKRQAETAKQNAETPQVHAANDNLRESLKTQQTWYQKKIAALSDGIDNVFEKSQKTINDNAVGRAVNRIDSWRPQNKLAAKAMDKAGVIPAAAIVGSGVAAYEQYKSGDTKGAAATLGKGAVHASVYGAATTVGINTAAKGVAKASEKITAKVVEKKAAKTASKAVAKAAGKAAGKAVGKSVLKKIPLVSLGAGAYFAYERAKNGEWGKAGCELLSGALGCFPGLGTAASTAVDCGLAVADVKKTIKQTKKQQAAAQSKPKPTPAANGRKNVDIAKKISELRCSKTEKGCQRLADRQLLNHLRTTSLAR